MGVTGVLTPRRPIRLATALQAVLPRQGNDIKIIRKTYKRGTKSVDRLTEAMTTGVAAEPGCSQASPSPQGVWKHTPLTAPYTVRQPNLGVDRLQAHWI